MRLDKFLAESSVGTRKTVRTYIKEAMVKVNKTVFDFFDDVNMNGVFHVGRLRQRYRRIFITRLYDKIRQKYLNTNSILK